MKIFILHEFPLATAPPDTDVTLIESTRIEEAISLSKESPRKRIISPFHKSADNTLHRMFNVVQPGSYIRPHSHMAEQKSESVVVLRGAICFVTFDENGKVLAHHNLYANSDVFGVDLEPNVIHTFFALEEDTVVFEVKPGPYIKQSDKGFASWSPEEHTPEAAKFLQNLVSLTQKQ